MAYERHTLVSYETETKPRKGVWLSGHCKVESAYRWARSIGATGTVRVSHEVFDTSGKGRGGNEGRWTLTIPSVT